jgi:hypothetical protein
VISDRSPKSFRSKWRPALLAALAVALCSAGLAADGKSPGLLDIRADAESGSILLQLPELPAEFLYVTALQSGVGSNDLGLDRGKLGRTRLVRFERFGNRVLLLEPNLGFRANSPNELEQRAVNEAFAQSVLAGFEIQDPKAPIATIDLTSLLLSDATRLAETVRSLEQGDFELDTERSAVDTRGIRSFPKNTLIPVVSTFKGLQPGDFVQSVTPTPDSLTVRVLHQFIEPPDDAYRPRPYHPRSGYFALRYRDYAAPLGQNLEQRLINRHRLRPGETLKYYVDSGAPEPVRSALLEGAAWWLEAFEAAGFENGFAVDVLPPGADPLDVRYNTIQWVHRSTRGWSYGSSIADPRTGEIIKGHVSLGSLRVRQDQMIAEALTAPFTSPDVRSTAAQEMALARLRQLSAHEVGHTLGIDHNFAASFAGDASVMDYPHPRLYLDETDTVQLDRAYGTGVSPWDILTVRYGYTEFSAQDEAAGLADILDEAARRGIPFIADRDARVPGSAHPTAHLWDNGGDVMARLRELLAIRKKGLDGFSSDVLPYGAPMHEMEQRLVPVYLLHRYQVEATAKILGGVNYRYEVRGESPAQGLEPVGAPAQLEALGALTGLLRPEQLALPDHLRYLIPPPPTEFDRGREFFSGTTGAPFDHLAPSRAGAELVINELLQPQRLARLAEQKALDPALPGARQVIDAVLDVSWLAGREDGSYQRAIQAEVNWIVLRRLMALGNDPSASETVRAKATASLMALSDRLGTRDFRKDEDARVARQLIRRFLDLQEPARPEAPSAVPPGPPIG